MLIVRFTCTFLSRLARRNIDELYGDSVLYSVIRQLSKIKCVSSSSSGGYIIKNKNKQIERSGQNAD